MAKLSASSISFMAFILIFVLFSNSASTVESVARPLTEKPTQVTEAKTTGDQTLLQPENLCEKASQTFTGFCWTSTSCYNQCRNRESASQGACHGRGLTMKCFCYFNC